MSEMQQALGLHGGQIKVMVGDDDNRSTWMVSLATKKLQSQHCAWMVAKTIQDLHKDRWMFPDEGAYHGCLAKIRERVSLGKYDWKGEMWWEFFKTQVGSVALLRTLLQPCHGDLPYERVEQLSESNPEGFVEAIKEAVGLLDTDPTKTSRVPEGSPSPSSRSAAPSSSSPTT